jgi:hypothetical protein
MSQFFSDPKKGKDAIKEQEEMFQEHTEVHDESEGSEFLDEDLRMKEQPLEYDGGSKEGE